MSRGARARRLAAGVDRLDTRSRAPRRRSARQPISAPHSRAFVRFALPCRGAPWRWRRRLRLRSCTHVARDVTAGTRKPGHHDGPPERTRHVGLLHVCTRCAELSERVQCHRPMRRSEGSGRRRSARDRARVTDDRDLPGPPSPHAARAAPRSMTDPPRGIVSASLDDHRVFRCDDAP